MIKRAILAAAVLFFSNVYAAQALEFQGIKLGDDIQSVKDRYWSMRCVDISAQDDADSICRVTAIDYAVPIRDVMFTFKTGKLTSITAEFDSGEFETLQKAAVEKFGKATSLTAARVQNGFGATRNGAIAIWERGDTRLMIGKYGVSLSVGRLFFEPSKPRPDKTKQNASKM